LTKLEESKNQKNKRRSFGQYAQDKPELQADYEVKPIQEAAAQ
jgi:hypothetical protein